jgi:heat shock protein HslJ
MTRVSGLLLFLSLALLPPTEAAALEIGHQRPRFQPTWPLSELDGTRWRVTTVAGQDFKGRHANIRFINRVMIMANACNFFESWFRVEGRRLILSGMASRERGCPSENAKQAYDLLEYLHEISTFQHAPGKKLTLTTKSGKRIVAEVGDPEPTQIRLQNGDVLNRCANGRWLLTCPR